MTYVPNVSVFDKVARKLRRFQNTRTINFKIDRPIISITFDDFPKTAVTFGAREMEKRGMAGTFYTCAGLAGTTNHHGPQFDAEDLPKLEAAGHEIAGHTYHHMDCLDLTKRELFAEITKNRDALKAMGVTQTIENFAYPYGQLNAALKSTLEDRFVSLRGITDGVHVGSADLNELKSCGYYSGTAPSVLSRIESLKSNPGWLTIFTHDIQNDPTEWGCTQSEFTALLDAVETSGARVMTVRGALKTLEVKNG